MRGKIRLALEATAVRFLSARMRNPVWFAGSRTTEPGAMSSLAAFLVLLVLAGHAIAAAPELSKTIIIYYRCKNFVVEAMRGIYNNYNNI